MRRYFITRANEKVLNKSIKLSFKVIISFITTSFLLIKAITNGIFEVSKMIYKEIKNYRIAKRIGYSYQEIESSIRNMSPRQFEIFCAELFNNLGYKSKVTQETCDGGKDVILRDKENNITFVECKHYAEHVYVGREICQKLLGSTQQYGASKSILINTGVYHKNAIECANMVDNLELWDMNDIIIKLMSIEPNIIPRIFMKTLNKAC